MLGNLGGFVAPVVGGVILAHTGGNWNLVLEVMAVLAVISALCWLYLDPKSARPQTRLIIEPATASVDTLAP